MYQDNPKHLNLPQHLSTVSLVFLYIPDGILVERVGPTRSTASLDSGWAECSWTGSGATLTISNVRICARLFPYFIVKPQKVSFSWCRIPCAWEKMQKCARCHSLREISRAHGEPLPTLAGGTLVRSTASSTPSLETGSKDLKKARCWAQPDWIHKTVMSIVETLKRLTVNPYFRLIFNAGKSSTWQE